MVLVEKRYSIQPVQAVSKLASIYKISANFDCTRVNQAISYNIAIN